MVAAYEEGGTSIRKVAQQFRVSPDTVRRLLKRKQATGDVEPLKSGGSPPSVLAGHDETLSRFIEEHPDWTLREYQEYFREHYGVNASESAFCRKLQKLRLSLKKNLQGQSSVE